jgi:phosphate:Na+ symporter
MEAFSWSVFIGGITFFFYGLKSARKGLEVLAGNRLKGAMGRIAGNRIAALGFGAFITLVLQSSGATSAMLVSFTETGLLSLFQATAVLLGADIGTTAVVVLLSIKKITDFALIIVASGFALQMWGRNRKARDTGSIVLGFGLIFYGMYLMTVAAAPLKADPMAMKVFAYLAGHPFATLVGSSIMAGAIHSAGMIGIAIALAFAGTITFEASVPIVLGANIGSCVTAVLASFSGGIVGKRVAVAHTLTKVIGVALVFPFIPRAAALVTNLDAYAETHVTWFGTGVAAKIALTHILFNVGLAVIFIPLLKPLIRLVEIILPLPPNKEEAFGPKYLDKAALETPAIAFAQAKREIMRIASVAQGMFEECLKMFSRGEDYRDAIERIQTEDDKIDLLEKAIRFYLAEVAAEHLSRDEVKVQMALIGMAHKLEEVGDTISKEMAQLAFKKAKWHRLFSDEGWKDLRGFQSMIVENFNLMLSTLAQAHPDIAMKITRHEEHMNDVEQDLRQAHITRLHQGLRETFDTSSIHLDILSNLRRINTMVTSITLLAMECS